jgi:5-aminopentanamidase
MKLALYQGPSPAGGISQALTKIGQMVSAARQAGAELVVFPELFLPGYNQPDLIRALAQPRDRAWERAVADIAVTHRCAIVFGWAEQDSDECFNTASVIDDAGQVIARHRKLQLFGAVEPTIFQPGDHYTAFTLGGLRIGVLICYDIEFAHHVRNMADQGVNLIVVPTANPDLYDNVPMVLVPARALENGIAIAYANYCGAEGDLTYSGLSTVVGPGGHVLASAGREEALLIVDIPNPGTAPNTQQQDRRVLSP